MKLAQVPPQSIRTIKLTYPYLVRWERREQVGYTIQEKGFQSYRKANGFANTMLKRGCFVFPIVQR